MRMVMDTKGLISTALTKRKKDKCHQAHQLEMQAQGVELKILLRLTPLMWIRDACKFEGITDDAKKMDFFLMSLEDGARNRDEAMARDPTKTLAKLIEELKLRFENPLFSMRFKAQLRTLQKMDNESVSDFYSRVTRMAKKANGGV
ncbi:hypothetical protein B9Z55_000738 [Caenorhabditis nigoni]|uniref:Retrotransposon gag domain-containing protein n=2 Tax=Caenorhabditis nigoni TaxID=1611254 RepID=A0A2G5VUJ8_9PELO|nr:hypothetical protein B9Z55_000738 [Caenorhabditis nigoni]